MNKYKRKALNIRLMFISDGYKKANLLRKKCIFGSIGDNVYYQPYTFGTEPHLLYLHNNVHIAANVNLITHSVIGMMAKNMLGINIKNQVGPIVIKENVFIGSGSVVMPNVTIESNVIVAAGSVVTKNIPTGVIIGGNPAKIIGSFDNHINKLIEWSKAVDWDEFVDPNDILINKQRKFFEDVSK